LITARFGASHRCDNKNDNALLSDPETSSSCLFARCRRVAAAWLAGTAAADTALQLVLL